MNFETVERCGRIHVSINGVVSAAFIQRDAGAGLPAQAGGGYTILEPRVAHVTETLEEAARIIRGWMDDWYTIPQAAERLVGMGVFDKPPSAQMMGIWCRAGKLPGAMKVRGPKMRGGGGAWRIPDAGLVAFAAERREGQ